MPTKIYRKGLKTNSRRWSDLDLDFIAHPVTKDIISKTDVEAVKRSVRNLILTNRYERPFQPDIDGGVTRHLFELSTPHTKHDIKNAIETCIANFEPRASVISVIVGGDLDKNGFDVTINFRVVNTPDPVTIELFLERLR
jgi:phage baseplate assembly protein W